MSASSVMEELDDGKYEVTPVFIDRAGQWSISIDTLREFDVVFPVLHGPMGEDGTVQGLLKVMNVPFVGAGVVGSAVGMDKAIFKDVMRAHKLPVAKYAVLRCGDRSEETHELTVPVRIWREDMTCVMCSKLDEIVEELGLPLFVKPANMGSSVGITKCKTVQDVHAGIADAFEWDRKILIEEAIPAARELEVSVLGNDHLKASIVGEIKPSREFYDYAAKYLDKGEQASALFIPADIPDALSALVRETAVEAAQLADVQGMARVDFLMNSSNGKIYLNEINTIPGFTSISMYPKLWVASGMTYASLLDRLIELAMERRVDGLIG
jgi:D-alanine-D-alanine ligase